MNYVNKDINKNESLAVDKKIEYIDCLENSISDPLKQKCLPEFKYPGCKKESYQYEEIVGPNAICKLDPEDPYPTDAIEYCHKQKDLELKKAFLMVKTQFPLASKQTETDFYSAKLLSMTQRTSKLGMMFDRLKQKIRKTYAQICKCNN